MDHPSAHFVLDPVPTWKYKREGELWMAVCDRLGLVATGEDFPEMVACVTEVMESLFQDLLDEGDMEGFMQDRGICIVEQDVPEHESPCDMTIDTCWVLETQ